MRFSYLLSKIVKKIQIPSVRNSVIHFSSKISSGTSVVDSTMEEYSYIGNNCTIVNVKIGKFCSIADNCIIGGSSHPIHWISTSPVFCEGKNIIKKNFSEHPFQPTQKTLIGNDVWIGSNALIKGGVSIGNGAIIGMGSVLTKNIGDYEIWAGNPAKLIKYRYDKEIIDKVVATKWWDFEDKLLKKHSAYFNDVEKFLEEVQK